MVTACCMIATAIATAQTIAYTEHVSSANGLSNDFVVELAIDDKGQVWVATEAGLNRIAGKSCIAMDEPPLDGLITSLYWYENTGNMFIGTERGLTLYHTASGNMQHLNSKDGLMPSSINDIARSADGGLWLVYGDGQIQHLDCTTMATSELKLPQQYGNRCAMDDGQGHLYIGHSQHGMTVVNISDGSSRNYQQLAGDSQSLPGNNVRCIYQDGNGRIWVGTDTGLALFHPEKGTFTKVTDGEDRFDDNVYDILQTKDGKLWIATDIGGVKRVEQGHYTDTQVRLSSLNTRSLAEDEYGNIWVGNHSAGVDFISYARQDFSILDYKNAEGRRPAVSAMAADPQQGFWMASENELVWCSNDTIKGRWSSLKVIRRKYVYPRCMMADTQGGVWIGVDDQGVYRFDKQQKSYSYIPLSPEGSDIHCFAQDAEGCIWIGGEFGVYVCQNGKAEQQLYVSQTIHAPATTIIERAPQQLFIATLGDGIYAIDLQRQQYRHLSIGEGLPSSKINHTISDGSGGVWLATDNGLVHVEDTGRLTGITVYGKEQGLADCHIRALQQDANGRIWMSTYSGISYLVKNTGRCYNYNHDDIRMAGGFANGAVTKDNNGNIYFGAAGGVCCFNPQNMGNGNRLSQIQITACEAYNPVGSNTEIQLLTPDEKGRVTTTYRQNTIRLTFAMRNFAQNAAVDYSYMMKGMDGKWYDIGNDHDVVFRGLRPGEYTFILRAKLRNQDWEKANETRLTIVITPPFWSTWWAYILYAMAAVALAAYLLRSYKRKLTLRNALELERRESQQKQEMNEERLRFFTNITHELRTPLTLILGPLDDMMADRSLSQQSRQRVTMIHKNAERLRGLINEILEFRKTETQNRRLTVAKGDIGQFVREICLNYKELNRNPKVQFGCNIADNLPPVWFDSEIITTVMNNLLSNAIKYTDEGRITTTVDAADGTLRIAVADTGHGIAPEALPHIFERYYQAKGSHQASGTGIGLALVKALATLHEGTVSVESHERQGSCFTFTIDISNTYPNALHKEDVESEADSVKREGTLAGEHGSDEKSAAPADALPMLLIVEDNDDIRQYIADTFCEDFRILQAENGQSGLQMAEEHIPDIIVSDIMMPKMNGIELTRQLKDDIRTSHIPIILLTAKDSDEDKEEGYDSGADSYLTKPFTVKLLASRIRNLMNTRRRLAELIINNEKAGSLPDALADETAMQPQLSRLDQEFIERLNRLIEEHIMQATIDMAFITDKMAMSHSTFYRKVKALTGMTATEYVRKRRLRHCYQLLESGDYNVNQAAMMTGFNQMAHFRETFKKEFGILPSEVKKK
jgi:signal transduction histidine kinase/ligand-binding sensor domain-containing protein/DNA-binding response OmpR family regulator